MPDTPPGDITELLKGAGAGDSAAADRLIAVVYAELHQLAASYLRRERPDHTLQTTALVHEAWIRLAGQRGTSWQNRGHFFGIAAQAMRRVLVDHARRRNAGKRVGDRAVTLGDEPGSTAGDSDEILAVDEALERLAALDARQARIVELRYFAGFTVEETAQALGISPATVKRDWTSARAWLQRELG
jgi:RNA polymerase sigma factor (TIGR02999 family)